MATYQQWSQSYFTYLTLDQHDVNNQWFQSMRDKLTDSGVLYVPILDKEFNKLDYDPKTKYWEFRVKVPGISKEMRDFYTDTNAQFYTQGGQS